MNKSDSFKWRDKNFEGILENLSIINTKLNDIKKTKKLKNSAIGSDSFDD